MKKKKYLALILPVLTFFLELLPNGVVMRFLAPPGEEPHIIKTSYFDLLPFGYGNFAPLVTAILTCVLILTIVICVIKENQKLKVFIKYTALLAAIISVCPIFFRAYTLVGGIISALLLFETVYLFIACKKA